MNLYFQLGLSLSCEPFHYYRYKNKYTYKKQIFVTAWEDALLKSSKNAIKEEQLFMNH